MSKVRIAVKSFIVKDEKLLIIKRADDESYMPGIWEIPGGKVDLDEDPFDGLKRETKEETGLDIKIVRPLNVQYFKIRDQQAITMIIFECLAISDDVSLSKEHSDFEWIELNRCKNKLAPFFHKEVDIFNKNKNS